ncbi:AraC family transcriptional regulator [Paenibacillus thalictri]|uniref:AraC family transcriptional regulator n=1 Tax=Paenibacillus thalictri TaxID=2527873 RepID=A0A4Q9DHL0_9BACL|nr:AraC family transcriptional regulator [Paenibacillus thalictri]TBL70915.1 AraC family transcriptional regulator [Paenibacillus thalictri]
MLNATQLADYLHKSVFSITFAGNTILPAGKYQAPYVHKIHSIHYIVKGSGFYVMNGVKHTLEAGSVMIFVPDTTFEWLISDTEDVEIYHIRFDCQMCYKDKLDWVFQASGNGLAPLRGKLAAVRPAEVRRCFEQVYQLWKTYDPISQYRCDLAFRELWLSLIDNLYDQQYSSDTDSMVQFTCRYIEDHIQSSLTVEQLAKMTGLSTGYYSRQFKRLTGYAPKDYIIRLRLNKAKELLEQSGLALSDISKLVGYDDEFYFSRMFKRFTGMTPSYYARQSQRP